jgi:thiol-disulfide isomerase/thioredoxin
MVIRVSILACAFLFAGPTPRQDSPPDVRGSIVVDTLLDLQITTLDGEIVGLRDLLGDGITVVNLWATWCLPCKDEIPDLNEFFRRHGGTRLTVVGIAVESGGVDKVAGWLAPYDVRYPIGLGVTGQEMIDVFRAPGLPFTLIVDSGGGIRRAMYGQQTVEGLERAVAPYLEVAPYIGETGR